MHSTDYIENQVLKIKGNATKTIYYGFFLLSFAVIIYGVIHFEFGFHFSKNNSDWAAFGSYLGGVAGPFLSFLALVLLSTTTILQVEALTETRRSNNNQVKLLEGQLELLRKQHQIERLEAMSETARTAVEIYLKEPVVGFENICLSELIENLITRVTFCNMLNKPITLYEAVEAERQGLDPITTLTDEKSEKVLISYVITIETIPKLAWSLEDFQRSISKMATIDDLNDERDIKSYVYARTQPYRRIVRNLYILGLIRDSMINAWGMEQDFIVSKGPSIKKEPVVT